MVYVNFRDKSGNQKCIIVFSDCHVTKENKNFLVLSDKQTDANTGLRKCSSLGGKLYEVTSQTASQKIKGFMTENLISKDKNVPVSDLLVTINFASQTASKNRKILNKKF